MAGVAASHVSQVFASRTVVLFADEHGRVIYPARRRSTLLYGRRSGAGAVGVRSRQTGRAGHRYPQRRGRPVPAAVRRRARFRRAGRTAAQRAPRDLAGAVSPAGNLCRADRTCARARRFRRTRPGRRSARRNRGDPQCAAGLDFTRSAHAAGHHRGRSGHARGQSRCASVATIAVRSRTRSARRPRA